MYKVIITTVLILCYATAAHAMEGGNSRQKSKNESDTTASNLRITPLDLKAGEEVTVRIKANSNGKLAYLDLRLRASKSGMDSIDAEREETPVYYNLQGIRTDDPCGGVFIRVTGNKTERVIIM